MSNKSANRQRLPNSRGSITFDVEAFGLTFTVTAGRFDDGAIAETFIRNHVLHCRLSQIGRGKSKLEKPKPAPQSESAGAAFDDEITFAPEWRG